MIRRRKTTKLKKYVPLRLVNGQVIQQPGLYAAVPDRGYIGHPFKIEYWYTKKNDQGEDVYYICEKQVQDWEKDAVTYRTFQDKFGTGTYRLGYFKMADQL